MRAAARPRWRLRVVWPVCRPRLQRPGRDRTRCDRAGREPFRGTFGHRDRQYVSAERPLRPGRTWRKRHRRHRSLERRSHRVGDDRPSSRLAGASAWSRARAIRSATAASPRRPLSGSVRRLIGSRGRTLLTAGTSFSAPANGAALGAGYIGQHRLDRQHRPSTNGAAGNRPESQCTGQLRIRVLVARTSAGFDSIRPGW